MRDARHFKDEMLKWDVYSNSDGCPDCGVSEHSIEPAANITAAPKRQAVVGISAGRRFVNCRKTLSVNNLQLEWRWWHVIRFPARLTGAFSANLAADSPGSHSG